MYNYFELNNKAYNHNKIFETKLLKVEKKGNQISSNEIIIVSLEIKHTKYQDTNHTEKISFQIVPICKYRTNSKLDMKLRKYQNLKLYNVDHNESSSLFKNKIYANIDHKYRYVQFGDTNALGFSEDFRDYGLGSYFMVNLIQKLKSICPDYSVNKLTLSSADAAKDNKDRRNAFYRKFFPIVEFMESNEENGYATANKILDMLDNIDLPSNVTIEEISIYEIFSLIEHLKTKNNALHKTLLYYKRIYKNCDIEKGELFKFKHKIIQLLILIAIFVILGLMYNINS